MASITFSPIPLPQVLDFHSPDSCFFGPLLGKRAEFFIGAMVHGMIILYLVQYNLCWLNWIFDTYKNFQNINAVDIFKTLQRLRKKDYRKVSDGHYLISILSLTLQMASSRVSYHHLHFFIKKENYTRDCSELSRCYLRKLLHFLLPSTFHQPTYWVLNIYLI